MEQREEGDQWGLLEDITPEDMQIFQDYKEFALTPRGKRILEHLRTVLHVGETKTYEEELTANGKPTPIDVNALLIRHGMRRAWAVIESHVTALDRLEEMRKQERA